MLQELKRLNDKPKDSCVVTAMVGRMDLGWPGESYARDHNGSPIDVDFPLFKQSFTDVVHVKLFKKSSWMI